LVYDAFDLALRHSHQHVLGINLFEIVNENEQNVSANQKDTKYVVRGEGTGAFSRIRGSDKLL
jgi:hypothetical protein